MIEAGRFVMHYLVNSLWQTPLLLMAACLVSRILRKLGCAVQHRAWTAALIVAAIAPLGAFERSGVSVRLLFAGRPVNALAGFNSAPAAGGLEPGTVHLVPALYFTILFAYLIFLVLGGLRLGWGLHKTRKLVRHKTAIVLTPEAAEIWQRCKSAFAIPSTTLASSPDITGPVTIGTRNAVLLVPPCFLSESTREDIAAALGHECAHLERRDFFLNLLYQLISLPIAYHPAAWMMKSRVAETRELVCDRMAAERIASSRSYASSLLRLAAAMHAGTALNPHHAIGMFDANTLENRIMSLMISQPSVSRGRKMVLLASGILLLSLSGLAAVALTANVEELASPPHNKRRSRELSIPSARLFRAGHRTRRITLRRRHTYHVGGPVSAPKLIYAPDPKYPKEETKKGVVIVALIVDAKGLPQQVHVARSLAPDFDKNAITAVEQYRFKPAMVKAKSAPKPVAVKVNIEVNFSRY